MEKNIPIPAVAGAKKYPFRKMKVGESFFVAGDEGKNMRVAARMHSMRNGDYKFSGRAVTEDGVEGHRLWRVK